MTFTVPSLASVGVGEERRKEITIPTPMHPSATVSEGMLREKPGVDTSTVSSLIAAPRQTMSTIIYVSSQDRGDALRHGQGRGLIEEPGLT